MPVPPFPLRDPVLALNPVRGTRRRGAAIGAGCIASARAWRRRRAALRLRAALFGWRKLVGAAMGRDGRACSTSQTEAT